MPDKCLDCPVPSADMDGFIVSGPGGAPRSESAGVSAAEGPFAKEAPQTGHFILKGKVSSSSTLPDVPEPGWAYEAAEAGTYGGAQATAGDVVWCAGVNPVRWAILQSDSGSAVSVEQILSSGTKIATVTVGGQATDLYCETGGGIQTLSGDFGCETQEISPAVDEPAVLYATKIVYLDQTGYEALQAGNRPSSGHYEYAVTNGTAVHDSSSFTTLPISNESNVQVPYAIALSTGVNEYASGYKLAAANVMDWPYGGAVKISDLLAAGEAGAKLVRGGGDVYGDGTLDVYASFSANQDGSYIVSYSARKDAVTEDVLTAKIDGKDGSDSVVSSVDVSPLLNYIGGKVEEVRSQEQVPLTDTRGLNPSDAVFPVYFNAYAPDVFDDANHDSISTASYSVSSDGSETFVLPSGSNPVYFVPYYTRVDSASSYSVYLYFVPESEGSTTAAEVSLDVLLSGPVELLEYVVDDQQSPPVPTGNTAALVMEAVEGDAPTYRCSLYVAVGEAKKVLRLYPSCDGDIDLSGLGSPVSVEQVLSSGTKIATVTVDGQATDLYCESDVVHLSGPESVDGAKTFSQGPFGTTSALAGSAVSLADGCIFTKTVSADTTFTITGVPAGKAATFNLILTNGGAYTVTWPASVKWTDGTAPDLTASGTDVLTFVTPDGGTTWYGTIALTGAV